MKKEYFSQIGTRENNEDFLGNNDHCIVVCDGIGGHASGEVASRYVVDFVLLNTNSTTDPFTKSNIQELLIGAQEGLNKQLKQNPYQANMGTTFTGLFRGDDAWYAAHIGDSRIYLIRPGEKKIWHTWDHSLVGELMKNKDITREAGRKHPMGNRISKAMMANEKGKTVKADIVKIDQLLTGYLFLLCSDGVNEAWPEHELVELLSNSSLSITQKTDLIKSKCSEHSKDNNTAFLIEIEPDDEINMGQNEELQWIGLQEFYDDYELHKKNIAEEDARNSSEEIVAEIVAVPEGPPPAQPNSIHASKQKEPERQYPSKTSNKLFFQNKIVWLVLAFVASLMLYLLLPGKEELPKDEKRNSVIIDNSKSNLNNPNKTQANKNTQNKAEKEVNTKTENVKTDGKALDKDASKTEIKVENESGISNNDKHLPNPAKDSVSERKKTDGENKSEKAKNEIDNLVKGGNKVDTNNNDKEKK